MEKNRRNRKRAELLGLPLTDSERVVLRRLALNETVKEIATRTDRSVKTIEAHKYTLMCKLNIHTTDELKVYARNLRIAAA